MSLAPFYRIKNICYNYTNRKYDGMAFIREMVVIMWISCFIASDGRFCGP
jgi:hypothetical protein